MKEAAVTKCFVCKKELFGRDKGTAWTDEKLFPGAVCLHHCGIKELIKKNDERKKVNK